MVMDSVYSLILELRVPETRLEGFLCFGKELRHLQGEQKVVCIRFFGLHAISTLSVTASQVLLAIW